jgi:hypothetical protein
MRRSTSLAQSALSECAAAAEMASHLMLWNGVERPDPADITACGRSLESTCSALSKLAICLEDRIDALRTSSALRSTYGEDPRELLASAAAASGEVSRLLADAAGAASRCHTATSGLAVDTEPSPGPGMDDQCL